MHGRGCTEGDARKGMHGTLTPQRRGWEGGVSCAAPRQTAGAVGTPWNRPGHVTVVARNKCESKGWNLDLHKVHLLR